MRFEIILDPLKGTTEVLHGRQQAEPKGFWPHEQEH